jgi:alcohol dehydrogenase class IV
MELLLPKQILFELGAINKLSEYVDGTDVLLITSKGMLTRGPVDKIKEMLGENKIFSDVEPEPSMETVEKAKALGADLVIGLGGGSVIDVAKYVAMELNAKKIMIPTTAGTGSEVTHSSVLKVDGKKKGFTNEKLVPDVAIVDPELTFTMPEKLTACTGIDALAHAVECHDSKKSNEISKFLAKEAIETIKENLNKAITGDKKAREWMSYASLLAGMAFSSSGTTLAHGLSYPLSNQGIPHGEAIAIVLPHAMDFNGTDPELLQQIKKVITDTGLGNVEIKGTAEELAEVVFPDKIHLENNPKPVTKEDLINIFKKILR